MRRSYVIIAELLIFLALSPVAGAQVSYTVLHNFAGGPGDGFNPSGGLVSDCSRLYGVADQGGSYGNGIMFSIRGDGSGYTIIHEFDGTGGSSPIGELLLDGVWLYGVASGGGASSNGVVFASGIFGGPYYVVIHDFAGGPGDGATPASGLVSDGSTLYGVTAFGGAYYYGTVFSLNSDGSSYTILHNFAGGPGDGDEPSGTLLTDGSTLYGVTAYGGANNYGTLFSLENDGSAYTILHDFDGTTGASPRGGLVSDGTKLYGTAFYGGPSYLGAVFSINPDGSDYTLLHNFNLYDGAFPVGSLLSDGSTLYGATFGGGQYFYYGPYLYGGVMFSISSDGTSYTLLHDFPSSLTDGISPIGSLLSENGSLSGTTIFGGTSYDGTIFSYRYGGDTFGKPIPVSLDYGGCGDTSVFNDDYDTYDCVSFTETGPDTVYSFSLDAPGDLSVTLSNLFGDLDLFLLNTVKPPHCLDSSTTLGPYDEMIDYPAAPGDYFVVVDGYDGATSAYDLDISFVTATPTPTETPTPTPTDTPTETPTPTNSPTPTPTDTPTLTPTPTITPTSTPTMTPSPLYTETPTPTPLPVLFIEPEPLTAGQKFTLNMVLSEDIVPAFDLYILADTVAGIYNISIKGVVKPGIAPVAVNVPGYTAPFVSRIVPEVAVPESMRGSTVTFYCVTVEAGKVPPVQSLGDLKPNSPYVITFDKKSEIVN